MGLWNSLSNDPKKLAAMSDFLTGFGSGINAGNKPGVSPLAALSMGFQGGTQGIKEAENRRRETAYKDMQMQKLLDEHLKFQEAQKMAAEEQQADDVFKKRFSAIPKDDHISQYRLAATSVGSPLARSMLSGLKPDKPGKPVLVQGPNGPVYESPSGAVGKTPPTEGIDLGSGIKGQAWTGLADLRNKQAAGEELTPEDLSNARIFQAILTAPDVRTDANGNLITTQTTLPEDIAALGAAPTVQPTSQAESPSPETGDGDVVLPESPQSTITENTEIGGVKVTTLQKKFKEEEPEGRLNMVIDMIREIGQFINEHGGESLTGIKGAASANFGGLARQVGVDVDPSAAELRQRLEMLSMFAVPIVSSEKKLSNQDRERMDKIIGSVSTFTDEKMLRNNLKNLYLVLKELSRMNGWESNAE